MNKKVKLAQKAQQPHFSQVNQFFFFPATFPSRNYAQTEDDAPMMMDNRTSLNCISPLPGNDPPSVAGVSRMQSYY